MSDAKDWAPHKICSACKRVLRAEDFVSRTGKTQLYNMFCALLYLWLLIVVLIFRADVLTLVETMKSTL